MSRSFLTSHVPGSSSPFCIVLGVPWRTAVFPHSNCWHLRSTYCLHGHQWVTCQSVLNIYGLSGAVLGTRNVVVNKTQSLTWKVYTGCRGKKKNNNKKQALTTQRSLPWWGQAWEHGCGGVGTLTCLWGCGLGMGGLFQGSVHQEVVPSKHLKKLLTRKRSAKRWGKAFQAEEIITTFPRAWLRAAGY